MEIMPEYVTDSSQNIYPLKDPALTGFFVFHISRDSFTLPSTATYS